MLFARTETLRFVSRARNETVAVRNPAQCLPLGVCAARQCVGQPDRGCCRERGGNAAVARGTGHTGGYGATTPRLGRGAAAGGGAGRAVSGDLCAARSPEPVLSRDRRNRRRAARHRDVAPCARPRHAACRIAGTGAAEMTCNEAEILLHALLDGELDAGHAREVEDHIAGCPRCAAELRTLRDMHKAMTDADLRYTAPPALRRRIEAALPQPRLTSRRSLLQGFAFGSAVSALAATGLVAIVLRNDDEQRIQAEVVSAHIRSLQPGHLTDVVSTDQHTVKPWFSGKLDVAPPVVDLTAQGFMLIGGRLDSIDARALGAVVYRRRSHVINLFVGQGASAERRAPRAETVQGFNIRRWSERGLNYWAVSDLGADELAEFGEKFEAAMRSGT